MHMDPTYHGLGAPVPTNGRRRMGFSPKMMLFIIVGIVVIIIGVVLLTLSRDSTAPLQSRLSARLDTLQRIVAEGQKNLRDPDLKTINSQISIQVLSDSSAIKSELQKLGMKSPDKTMVAAEADTASFTVLRDAALNNRFDDAYRKLIAQKLDSTNALIKEIYDKSSRTGLKQSLNTAYTDFNKLQNQLSAPATN